MFLYGASGHARVIIEILELLSIPINGLIDDNPIQKNLLNYPIYNSTKLPLYMEHKFIITIGDNIARKLVSEKNRLKIASPIFHPQATISKYTEIDIGSVVIANAIINPGVKIGKHVIINTSASVDHDCKIGDYCHISPNSTLSGGVIVGDGALIGAGSVVIPNIKIGKWSVIGAGSVIIRDIPANSVVVGNPGRVIRKNR